MHETEAFIRRDVTIIFRVSVKINKKKIEVDVPFYRDNTFTFYHRIV